MNAPDPAPDPITHNIESIEAFYQREDLKVTESQRVAEAIGNVIGRPVFLGCIVAFVMLWILVNLGVRHMHLTAFDSPPCFWLQGIVSLLALLTTTVVLIRQERLAKLEERREHLELQVNLLTEQKTTKLIHLLEELRRDLPMVRYRRDPESEAMLQPTDPHRVLAEMDEARAAAEQSKADAGASAPKPAPRAGRP